MWLLKKYYLDKGISVIITRHSSATISLALENTLFYKVFNKNKSRRRLIKISRDEYNDLQKVNKRFYEKISNQSKRIKELKTVIDSVNEITIITEGKTD